MSKKKGYEILLGILAFIQIGDLFFPFFESIEKSRGELTSFIVLILIIVLLFKEY